MAITIQIDSPFPTYESIIRQVQSQINIPTLPPIPTLPTVTDFTQQIKAQIPDIRQQLDQIPTLDLNNIDALMSFVPPFEIPPFDLTNIPDFLNIPIPLVANLRNPTQELSAVIQYIQNYQINLSLTAGLSALLDIVGGAIDSIIPPIPVLNIPFTELISGSYDALIALIKTKLDEFSALLPSPLLPGIVFPDLEAAVILKMLKTQVQTMLITAIQELIAPVLDILELAGSLTIPTIPTMQELRNMILSRIKPLPAIPTAEDIEAQIRQNVDSLITGLDIPSIPGFELPLIPMPLQFDATNFTYDINESVNILFSDFTAQVGAKIEDFFDSTLGLLGVEFPTITVTI